MDTTKHLASNAKNREGTKKGSLSLAYEKLDKLISNVGIVDNKVATKVEQLKNNFYSKYSYLKPECEKSGWEQFVDGTQKLFSAIFDFGGDVLEWLGDHWKELLKAITVIVLAVVSVVLLCTGVGGPLAAACWGCIFGIVGGFLSNGISNVIQGKGFFDGALDAMFYGGIGGAIGGAICGVFSGGLPLVNSLGKAVWRGVWTGALSGFATSFVTGSIQYLDEYGLNGTFKDYLGYVGSNVLMGTALGGTFGGIFGGISFKVGQIRTNNRINNELAKAKNNYQKGKIFEKICHKQIFKNPKYLDSKTQITMYLNGGSKNGGTTIIMDEIAITKNGVNIFEFKSSSKAPFTNYTNVKGGGQTAAYVNNGFKLSAPAALTKKGIDLLGYNILPQNMPVTVIRPENFVANLGIIQDGFQSFYSGISFGLTSGISNS